MPEPLTGRTEQRHGEMTVELLRYANREKVAQALTDGGYRVSRATVNRWARGDEAPAIAQRMIAALFGHEAGQARERASADAMLERWLSPEPPPWATVMTARILAAIENQVTARATQVADQVVDLLSERYGALVPPPADEDAPAQEHSASDTR